MKMSPVEVSLYVFVLGAAISFAVAGLIRLTFVCVRTLQPNPKPQESEAPVAPKPQPQVIP